MVPGVEAITGERIADPRNRGEQICPPERSLLGVSSAVDTFGLAFGAAGASAPPDPRLVIGRLKDISPDKLGPGEYTLISKGRLPNLNDPKANWRQNSSELRREMQSGRPIRDASPDDHNDPFLNAERNLLNNRGWQQTGNYWHQ